MVRAQKAVGDTIRAVTTILRSGSIDPARWPKHDGNPSRWMLDGSASLKMADFEAVEEVLTRHARLTVFKPNQDSQLNVVAVTHVPRTADIAISTDGRVAGRSHSL
jgi:hypothetical protein